jgi:hypothetical protein
MPAEVPNPMSDPPGGHDPAHPNSDHGDGDHGHADHGDSPELLGPIDVPMWSVGLLGVALGLLVAVCVAFATGVF